MVTKIINRRLMNHLRHNLFRYLALACIPLAVLTSCKDDEAENLNLTRRFKPAEVETKNGETSALIEWSASLFTFPGEVEYEVEVAKADNNFANVEHTAKTTDTELEVADTEIEIRTDYVARVRALGTDGVANSNWIVSEPFRITGELLIRPVADYEVLTDGVMIRWNPKDVLTKLVITQQGGSSVTLNISEEEAEAGEKIVDGLTPNTQYVAELFLGEVSKGQATFRTKISWADANVIDLTQITDNPTILADTIPDIPSGSVVLLKRGVTYYVNAAIDIQKSITFTSAPDYIEKPALIMIGSNFNITENSTIDSVVFRDVNLRSNSYNDRYVFNINRVGTINKVRFENVNGQVFRGFFRIQTGGAGAQVGSFLMNNCVVDSLRDFSLVNTNNSNTVANIRVTNSTISNARKVIDHRSPGSNSIVFNNCTFYNLPTGNAAGDGSNYFLDMDTQNSANPIIISNCIFAKTRDENTGGSLARGIRVGGTTNVNVTNSYRTNDFSTPDANFQIPGLLEYSKASGSLFANPVAENFKIVDASFAGAATTGDPRWR